MFVGDPLPRSERYNLHDFTGDLWPRILLGQNYSDRKTDPLKGVVGGSFTALLERSDKLRIHPQHDVVVVFFFSSSRAPACHSSWVLSKLLFPFDSIQ